MNGEEDGEREQCLGLSVGVTGGGRSTWVWKRRDICLSSNERVTAEKIYPGDLPAPGAAESGNDHVGSISLT